MNVSTRTLCLHCVMNGKVDIQTDNGKIHIQTVVGRSICENRYIVYPIDMYSVSYITILYNKNDHCVHCNKYVVSVVDIEQDQLQTPPVTLYPRGVDVRLAK